MSLYSCIAQDRRAGLRQDRAGRRRQRIAHPQSWRYPCVFFPPIRTMIKRARDLNQLIDLVHEAVYEVDELRACLEHDDDDEASTYTPYLDSLDKMLRDLHESMVSGKYTGTGQGEDLAFMPLFKRHERDIPFRELLRTINATHREGFEV